MPSTPVQPLRPAPDSDSTDADHDSGPAPHSRGGHFVAGEDETRGAAAAKPFPLTGQRSAEALAMAGLHASHDLYGSEGLNRIATPRRSSKDMALGGDTHTRPHSSMFTKSLSMGGAAARAASDKSRKSTKRTKRPVTFERSETLYERWMPCQVRPCRVPRCPPIRLPPLPSRVLRRAPLNSQQHVCPDDPDLHPHTLPPPPPPPPTLEKRYPRPVRGRERDAARRVPRAVEHRVDR